MDLNNTSPLMSATFCMSGSSQDPVDLNLDFNPAKDNLDNVRVLAGSCESKYTGICEFLQRCMSGSLRDSVDLNTH